MLVHINEILFEEDYVNVSWELFSSQWQCQHHHIGQCRQTLPPTEFKGVTLGAKSAENLALIVAVFEPKAFKLQRFFMTYGHRGLFLWPEGHALFKCDPQ